MSVYQHDYGIPSENELSALVGAATPHFAFQARARIQAYLDRLPADHPRAGELARQLERLDALGYRGEAGRETDRDLPARKSVPALAPERR